MKKRRTFSLLLICAMLLSLLFAGPTAFADGEAAALADGRQDQSQDITTSAEDLLTEDLLMEKPLTEEPPAAELEQPTEEPFTEEPPAPPEEELALAEEDGEAAPAPGEQEEDGEEQELLLGADEAEATLLGLTASCRVYEEDNGARLSNPDVTPVWKNGVEPTSSWYDFYGSDFYTNENCWDANQLTTRPEPGGTYYAYIYLSAPWVTIDWSQLTAANCHITVSGYTVENVTVRTETSGQLRIVLKLTKGPRVLTEFSITGTGMNLTNNKYRLTYSGCSYTWENDDAPAASAYRPTFTDVCSNTSCTTPITSLPAAGETCYVRCTILNTTANDHGISFSQLTADNCCLTLPDYTVECLSVSPGTSSGQDRVQITFKMTKEAPYQLKAFHDIPAVVRYGDGSSAYYLLASSNRSYEWWDDEVPGNVRCDDPYLYTNQACTNLLRSEPAQGGVCYTKYTVYNYLSNHDVDFSWLRTYNCSLAVAGYLAECISVTTGTDGSGRDCAYIIFKLTRGHYTLTGVSLSAEKVRAWETVELDGETAVCSWKTGETPSASLYGCYTDPICTDAACTHWLHTQPAPDTPYYVRARVCPNDYRDRRFDYSQLTTAKCSLTLPGYTTECISVEPSQGSYGSEQAAIIFKIVLTNPFTDVKPGSFYYDAVLWAYYHDPQITTGTTPTTFSPSNGCTRGQIVTFLWRAKGCPEPSVSNPFKDIKSTDFCYKAVLWAYQNGITTGTTPTTFAPNNLCTREQCVTFLWRAAGKPTGSPNAGFTDVKSGAFYADAVNWAFANGVTTGITATKFGVGLTCTRGQIVTFIYRYMT